MKATGMNSCFVGVIVLTLLVGASSFCLAQDEDIYSKNIPGDIPETPWWESFDNPDLTELIRQALAANPDILTTQSRVKQARAVAWQNLAPALPQISFELSGKQTAIEALGNNAIDQMKMAGQNVPDSYKAGSAMLVGRLELDLFGKRIMGHLASRKDALAAQQQLDGQAISLTVMIAQTYFDILSGRERLKAVRTQLKANEDLLDLVQLRYERGDADGLDVLQQKQQLASTATQLPLAEALLELSNQQLSILLGKPPSRKVELSDRPLPKVVGEIPIGRPSDLAVNNPELKSAETTLKAQTLRRNSAIVTFLPTISLYGQTGEQATYINDKEQNSVWEVGATISIPLFQGGGNIANYSQNRAARNAARHELRKQTLVAVSQVENAVTLQKQARSQLDAFTAQLEAASLTLQQAKSRYVLGLTDYQSVLTALTTQQQAELNTIEARVALINSRITLLSALGGQWTNDLTSTK